MSFAPDQSRVRATRDVRRSREFFTPRSTEGLGTRRNEEKEWRCVVVLTVRISHMVSRWCSAFAGGPSGRGVFLPRHRGEPLCFVRKGFQPNGAAFGALTTPRINICLKETPCGAELTLLPLRLPGGRMTRLKSRDNPCATFRAQSTLFLHGFGRGRRSGAILLRPPGMLSRGHLRPRFSRHEALSRGGFRRGFGNRGR